MNKTRIILVRHGETQGNRGGRILGQSDSPLTESGKRAVRELAESMATEGVGVVFSSPLGRAMLTAEIYAGRMGVPLFPRDAMAELSAGDWEARLRSEVLERPDMIRRAWSDRPPGGESYSDGERRVQPFIDELRAVEEWRRILVVGHGAVNRVFLKLWLGLEPDEAMGLPFGHGEVYRLSMETPGRIVSPK